MHQKKPTTAESFRFLGSTITTTLEWKENIACLFMKVQQWMFHLRMLNVSQQAVVQFCRTTTERVQPSYSTVWFLHFSVQETIPKRKWVFQRRSDVHSLPSMNCTPPEQGHRAISKAGVTKPYEPRELHPVLYQPHQPRPMMFFWVLVSYLSSLIVYHPEFIKC